MTETSPPMAPLLRRAVIVAAIVGPLLTLINQWEALFGDASFSVLKFLLTIATPFIVSLVSALMAARATQAKILEMRADYESRLAALEAELRVLRGG